MKHLPLLLKREFWEHRGGFLWTPFWIAAVILILTVLGIASAELFGGNARVHIGVSLDELRSSLSAGDIARGGNALDLVQMTFVGIACVGLFFVSFFYLLGALYDDRRDRSILFWKSLPLSDTATVASKALSAMLVMPAIALAVATLAYLAFVALICLWCALHGLNPLPLVLASHPLGMFARLAAMLPIGALWMLPAVGWLLFWSAWVRSKPFLWAVLVPVLAIIADKWLGLLGAPSLSGQIPLGYVLGRLLFSVMPGSWLGLSKFNLSNEQVTLDIADNSHVLNSLSPSHVYGVLTTANLWIGVAGGILLLTAAIWVRGRRIETSV